MSFNETFLALFPASCGRADLEQTGKILLPQSVLDQILRSNFHQKVMYFAVSNTLSGRSIAAGVESFTSDEVSCVIPAWMASYIGVAQHDKVSVSLQAFPTAVSVTFQPFSDDFNRLPDPKVILEHSLRQMPCLTQGSTIPIRFNDKDYALKVLKTEPSKTVSVLNANVATDFATPISQFTHHWGEEEEDLADKPKKPQDVFRGQPRSLK